MSPQPTHHPAEETLLAFAAGTLAPSRTVVISAHMPFCASCRATVRLHEAVGGALLTEQPPSDVAPALLNRVLARLDEPARLPETSPEPVWLAPGVPVPGALRGMVRASWRWLAPGVRRIVLDGGGRAAQAREQLYLLRVAAGYAMPQHGHGGWETTCVLSGGFTDASGSFGPGDLAELDENGVHKPVADPDEACICLIASEGPPRMHGWIARLLRPVLAV